MHRCTVNNRRPNRTIESMLKSPSQLLQDPTRKLQNELAEVKKQYLLANEANQDLKIEVRKLQNEVIKRDRKIRQASIINKAIADKRSSSIGTLNEKNYKLQKLLAEKNATIKALQEGKPEYGSLYSKDIEDNKLIEKSSFTKLVELDGSYLPEEVLYDFEATVDNDTRDLYDGLSRDHLLSIIQSLKNSLRRYSSMMSLKEKASANLSEKKREIENIEAKELNNIDEITAKVSSLELTSVLNNENPKSETKIGDMRIILQYCILFMLALSVTGLIYTFINKK